MSSRPSRCEPPRCDRSAPAQNAGGVAGDDHRADVRVGLELVERGDDLLDHVEVERVAALGVVEGDGGDAIGHLDADKGAHELPGAAPRPTPCAGSPSPSGSLALARPACARCARSRLVLSDHGGGVAEELLDVALVPVARRCRPTVRRSRTRLDEGLDRARRRVAGSRTRPASAGGCRRPARSCSRSSSSGGRSTPRRRSGAAARPAPNGGSGNVRLPQMAATSLHGSSPSPATL